MDGNTAERLVARHTDAGGIKLNYLLDIRAHARVSELVEQVRDLLESLRPVPVVPGHVSLEQVYDPVADSGVSLRFRRPSLAGMLDMSLIVKHIIMLAQE